MAEKTSDHELGNIVAEMNRVIRIPFEDIDEVFEDVGAIAAGIKLGEITADDFSRQIPDEDGDAEKHSITFGMFVLNSILGRCDSFVRYYYKTEMIVDEGKICSLREDLKTMAEGIDGFIYYGDFENKERLEILNLIRATAAKIRNECDEILDSYNEAEKKDLNERLNMKYTKSFMSKFERNYDFEDIWEELFSSKVAKKLPNEKIQWNENLDALVSLLCNRKKTLSGHHDWNCVFMVFVDKKGRNLKINSMKMSAQRNTQIENKKWYGKLKRFFR